MTETNNLSSSRGDEEHRQQVGSISGQLVDGSMSAVTKAQVKLSKEAKPSAQQMVTGENGQFSFHDVAPGQFQLAISADGFAPQIYSGMLHARENYTVPTITLRVATISTEVQVSLSRAELAELQVKDQEKQRVLGVVPNFYVTYDPVAVPLSAKQKFELAWKSTVDPINFALSGMTAGVQQATNSSPGFGQGAQGYAKRYAASYVDLVTANFVGSALLPTLLKQDPRYFYKGTGSFRSRILYAISASLICKGDNGHWQPNYSGIAGGLAAGEISTLYRPPTDHRGAPSILENALFIIGSTAADNILQEFVIRKLTPHVPSYKPAEQ